MVSIMHATNTYGEARHQKYEVIKRAEDHAAVKNATENADSKADDGRGQAEHPIFFTTCTAAEGRVFSKDLFIPKERVVATSIFLACAGCAAGRAASGSHVHLGVALGALRHVCIHIGALM